jgi:hypothetical protein
MVVDKQEAGMTDEEGDGDRFIGNFRRHLSQVDEVSNAILRGHLEVERTLDAVVDLIFFRPEYLKKVRLGFADKVLLARAYAPDPEAMDWNTIKCLNEARNAIAHRRSPEARGVKIANLRKVLESYGSSASRKEAGAADDMETVVLASAMCCGFLTFLEESVWKVRDTVANTLDVPRPPDLRE